tara:strand:- start:192 stop:422 length:231 start_codon:yes stop_codon:yes gene_type:complete
VLLNLERLMEDYVQDAYFNALIKEGLDASVIEWLAQMAEINDRTPSYFVMMALEEFKMYLDQSPEYEIELEEESVH